jgi:hypothetical protein
MSNIINADNGVVSGIAGIKYSADTSGVLVLQTNGTTAITINADQTVTFAAGITQTSLTTSGNLTFTSTGNRIIGDFSNATWNSKVAFQSSTTNGNTAVMAIPNGTATQSQFIAFNGTDADNSAFSDVRITATDARWSSSKLGTGTYLPATIYTGGSERLRIDTSGNVGIGTGSPSSKLDVRGKMLSAPTANTVGSYPFIQGAITDDVTYGVGLNLVVENSGSNYYGMALTTTFGNANKQVERMRITSTGYVGVGTSSPSYNLEVVGAISASGGASESQVHIRNSTSDVYFYNSYASNSVGLYDLTSATSLYAFSRASQLWLFYTSGAERLRIDSSGNVGIGGASPGARLDVRVPSGSSQTPFLMSNSVDADIIFKLNTSYSFIAPSVGIPFALGTAGAEVMRINSNSTISIGTTGVSSSRVYVYKDNPSSYNNSNIELVSGIGGGDVVLGFHAAGVSALCLDHVRGTGSVRCVNGARNAFAALEASAFTVGSDYRLKENIVPLVGALDRVANLPVHRFNFRPAEEVGMDYGSKTVDGFLAHEVAEVVPEAVFGEKDAVKEDGTPKYQSIDQAKLVPVLWAAIQELNAKVVALEAQLAAK